MMSLRVTHARHTHPLNTLESLTPFSFTFTFSPAFADSTSSSLMVMPVTSAFLEFGISSTELPTIYASHARATPHSSCSCTSIIITRSSGWSA